MTKPYRIETYRSVHDQEFLAADAHCAGPAYLAVGGRCLVRRTRAALEAGIDLRTAVMQFDGVTSTISACTTSARRAAPPLLGDAPERESRIVEAIG